MGGSMPLPAHAESRDLCITAPRTSNEHEGAAIGARAEGAGYAPEAARRGAGAAALAIRATAASVRPSGARAVRAIAAVAELPSGTNRGGDT